MSRTTGIDRRRFVQFCTSMLAFAGTAPTLANQPPGEIRAFSRARLIDHNDEPIRVSDLTVGTSYIFHYPYISTPCFLIRLEEAPRSVELTTEQGARYVTPGGVGPDHTVVAFSAICAHRMTHPVRAVNFINYRHEPVSFENREEQPDRRAGVIKCCSEKSVYDARQGARVLGGPAPQPLAAVLLEYSPGEDSLHALGATGGLLFDAYLEKFRDRLVLEYGTERIGRSVGEVTRTQDVASYCKNVVLC